VVALAEELLLLTLSPQQPRNTRAHQGIRAAVCGANVLDLWLAGAHVPADLRRHIRGHSHGCLEPALAPLTGSGRIVTAAPRRGGVPLGHVGARAETLADVTAGTAIRGRLRAALAEAAVPPPRDAALAVLLYAGRLWNWSGLEERSTEDVRVLGRRQRAVTPLKRQAEALAGGSLAPDHLDPAVLVAVAEAIDDEYVRYGD
jgi:hypothetical protein